MINRAVQLEMGKFDFAASWPAPFVGPVARDATEPRIEVQAFIPQSAGIGDLGRRAAEEYRSKPRHLADMAQRLQDQPDGFPATRRTAIYMQISAGVRRNSVCGPGSGEIVARGDDNISRTVRGSIKQIMTVVGPNGRDALTRHRSALIARGAYRRAHRGCRCRRFLAKNCCCASRNAAVSS